MKKKDSLKHPFREGPFRKPPRKPLAKDGNAQRDKNEEKSDLQK